MVQNWDSGQKMDRTEFVLSSKEALFKLHEIWTPCVELSKCAGNMSAFKVYIKPASHISYRQKIVKSTIIAKGMKKLKSPKGFYR